MLILPAIDLLDGQCVRLVQGNYSEKTVYADDAVSVAKAFEDDGAVWLHLVDLNGAKTGVMQNLGVVSKIASETRLKIELGGGVRSMHTANAALDAGVSRVVVGSQVIQDPRLAADLFGALDERAVAGLDAREGKIATSGWTQTSEMDVEAAAKWVEECGARRIILTDISKDGMLQGPNLELLQRVLSVTGIPIIQSGGISSMEDLRAVKDLPGRATEGTIVGKAVYENRINLADAIQEFQS